jgi:hypothetical protein
MRTIIMYRVNGITMSFNLDQKYIIERENELGAKLPSSYKEAMLSSNGGKIDVAGDSWELYPIFDKSDRKRISRTCNNIISETESNQEWEGFPANAIAVASNGCGDSMVFLKAETKYNDELYIWSHETKELTKVANKFTEVASL